MVRQTAFVWIPLVLALLFLAIGGRFGRFVAAQPGLKPAAFDKKQLDDAEALVRDVFKDEFAQAKTNKEIRKQLALTLLDQSKRILEEADVRFVALSLARDLAAQAGDHVTAFAAIAELGKHHLVDSVQLQAAALATVIDNTSEASPAKALAEMCLKSANDHANQDQFDLAVQYANLAENAAKKANEPNLLKSISGRAAELAAAQKDLASIQPFLLQLKTNPNDPAANLAVGKSWCFARDRWEKGLPYLAKGSDPVLQQLAKKDLEAPIQPAAQAALAAQWGEAAQKYEPGTKLQMLRRSYQWYTRAVHQLQGDAKTQVQTKIKELVQILPAKLRVIEIEAELKQLSGHTGEVLSLGFSPNGLFAVSGSADKSVQLWDLAAGKSVQTCTGHFGAVLNVVHALDGKHAFSCAEDKTVRMWDLTSGKEVRQFTGQVDFINGLSVSPDGKLLAGGGQDKQIFIWDIDSGKKLHQLAGHTDAIYRVAFSPDGSLLASCSADQTARIWDLKTLKQVKELRGHTGQVIAVAFAPDGTRLATGSDDNSLRLWNIATGKEVHKLTGHTSVVGAVAFSPEGTRVLSASDDRSLKLWDAETGQLLRTLDGHSDAVYGVAFSPDGRWVLSCSLDRTLRLWGERK